jgi:hypothetical protein
LPSTCPTACLFISPQKWFFVKFGAGYPKLESTTFADLENEKTAQFDAGYQYEQGAFKSWASVYADH